MNIMLILYHDSKPFQLLTTEGSIDSYGRSADRVVLMVLRVMEEIDPNFDDDLDENFCASLVSRSPHGDQDAAADSDSDSDSDLDLDSDTDSDVDLDLDSEFDCDSEPDGDAEDFGLEDDTDDSDFEDLFTAPDEEFADEDNTHEESATSEAAPDGQHFRISLNPEQIYAAKVLAQVAKTNKSQ